MLDKKKAISAILLKLSNKAPEEKMEEKPEGEEEGSSMDLEVAAEEIMAALEKKDAKRLVEALKIFIEMCD